MPQASQSPVRFVLPAALAFLVLSGLLAGLAPQATAAPFATLTQATGRTDINLGQAGIHVNGNVVAIAHVLSTNSALMLTLSLDGGATWNDYATGITGVSTSGSGNFGTKPPQPIAVSATNIAILYRTSSNEVITKTVDGGITWTTAVSTVNGTPTSCSTGIPMTNTLNDIVFVAPSTIMYSGTFYDATTNRVRIYKTTDFWATAATTLLESSNVHGGTCSSDLYYQSVALFPTSTTAPCAYFSHGGDSGTGFFTTPLSVSIAMCSGSQAFNDPISALTNWGWNLRADHTKFDTVLFEQGVNPSTNARGPIYAADKQASTGRWFFTQQAATPTAFGGDWAVPYSVNGEKGYFVSPDSGSNYLTRMAGTGSGYTASQAVAGTASSVKVNPSLYTDCTGGYQWLVLKAADGKLKFGKEAVSCTVQAVVAEEELSVPYLQGFDVSESGAQLVAREGNTGGLGRVIKVYNAQTFAAGGEFETGCAFVDGGGYSGIAGASIIDSTDGVNAGAQIVSFYVCPGGTEDVSGIIVKKVSNSLLVDPLFPQTCVDACYNVIDDGELAGNDDIRRSLSDLKEYPFDWSQHASDGANRAYLTWGFGTTEGDVGVMSLSQINNEADVSVADLQTLDSSGSRDIHVCTTRDGNNDRDLLWGVARGDGGTVKGYQVNYNRVNYILDTWLTFLFNPQVANPESIGCAEDKLLTVGSGEARLYTMGQPGFITVADCAGASYFSALSPDALTGACQDGDKLRVFRTSDGAVFQNMTLPNYGSASPCGIQLTNVGPAQNVYFGACGIAGKIYRWTMTQSPYNTVIPCPACDTDGDGIPNSADEDIDDDGLTNSNDPDIDGDGYCNSDVSTNQTADQANPGRVPCVIGDTDSDGDGYPDEVDQTPGGTPTGPGSGGDGDGTVATGFKAAAGGAGAIFGGGESGGALMMAVLVILCFAVGAGGIAADLGARGIVPAMMGGAMLGFAYAVFADLVPGIITFLLATFAVGFGVMRFKQARDG